MLIGHLRVNDTKFFTMLWRYMDTRQRTEESVSAVLSISSQYAPLLSLTCLPSQEEADCEDSTMDTTGTRL